MVYVAADLRSARKNCNSSLEMEILAEYRHKVFAIEIPKESNSQKICKLVSSMLIHDMNVDVELWRLPMKWKVRIK